MIVLQLYCSTNYAQNNVDVSSTGDLQHFKTALTTINDSIAYNTIINLFKSANTKMIERKYLLLINKEQDSIITMKDKYINEQKNIINDFQQRVETANKINQQVTNDLNKQKTKFNNTCYIGGGIIFALIISLLLK